MLCTYQAVWLSLGFLPGSFVVESKGRHTLSFRNRLQFAFGSGQSNLQAVNFEPQDLISPLYILSLLCPPELPNQNTIPLGSSSTTWLETKGGFPGLSFIFSLVWTWEELAGPQDAKEQARDGSAGGASFFSRHPQVPSKCGHLSGLPIPSLSKARSLVSAREVRC